MAKQNYEKFLKPRDDDCTSVKMVTEATKMILEYMKNFAEGLNELNEEIRFLMERVEKLEKGMGVKSKRKGKKQKEMPAFSLPHPPSVSYGVNDDRTESIDPFEGSFTPPRGESQELKSELRSVLAGGIKLKSVEEGKREERRGVPSPVYEDFKKTNQPMITDNVYAPPPIESKKEIKNRKKKKKSDDKATTKLREALARDLENAFGK